MFDSRRRGPRRPQGPCGALAAFLVFSLPWAAFGAPPASTQELVVVAAKTPKVVASYPGQGQTVPGGTVVLKVVFDQSMQAAAWDYGPYAGAKFPDCLDRPRLLEDRRTFVLLCSAALNTAFALSVNAAPDFTGAGGKPADPFVLRFSTSNDPAASLTEALKNAALTEADNPIMTATAADGAIIRNLALKDPPRP